MSYNINMEALRACLLQPPSPHTWQSLLRLLDALDGGVPVEYAAEHLKAWPDSLRSWELKLRFGRARKALGDTLSKPPVWAPLVRSFTLTSAPSVRLKAEEIDKLLKAPFLSNLTSLNLSGNKLERLSADIGRFTSLKALNLGNNELRRLPEEIGRLTSLTSLDLGKNLLVTLPEGIGQLTSLTSLSLLGNRLEGLPEEKGG